MPGGRTLPNLALQAFFDLGEDGWDGPPDDFMSTNLLKLSVLVQATVIDKVAAEPGSPADGDTYILDETHGTHPNEIAVYDVDAWKYFEPFEGWLIFNQTEDYYEKFDGAVWAELETGGGGAAGPSTVVEVSDTDTNLLASQASQYIRFTAATAKTLTVQPDATEAMPANGEWHIRNVGAADLTLVEGSGVTLNPPAGGTLVLSAGCTVTLKRAAEDEFDILGQTVAA